MDPFRVSVRGDQEHMTGRPRHDQRTRQIGAVHESGAGRRKVEGRHGAKKSKSMLQEAAALRDEGAEATLCPAPAFSHRIDPCKFATSAAPACVFPPSASAATISASAPISKPRAR